MHEEPSDTNEEEEREEFAKRMIRYGSHLEIVIPVMLVLLIFLVVGILALADWLGG